MRVPRCDRRRLRAVVVCAALAATAVARAETGHSGFEVADNAVWSGPWGGGLDSGAGKGEFVRAAKDEFVRSGDRAVRLTVWDAGGTNAVGWAFLAQKVACRPGVRVRAGASFYASSTVKPLPARAVAQLRLEYYYDDSCESQIPTHVMLSEPFTLANGHRPDAWHAVELSDRVPENAQCMKLSILLMAERPGTEPAAVWVDDAFLDVAPGAARAAREATTPRRPWWRRLLPERRP